MYEIKEIILRNNHQQKKRLIINFHEESYAILAEFLMSDAMLLLEELKLSFEQISSYTKESIVLTGNRCAVLIEKEITEISDLFDHLDSYSTLKIETEKFYEYINMWHNKLIVFNKRNE